MLQLLIRLVLLLWLTSCAHVPQARVEHYVGELTLKIPGSQTAFARYPCVVRITRDPEAGQMMEELVYPGKDQNAPAREIVSNFRITEKEGIFKVRDNLRSFYGLVQFSGKPWHWSDWAMNILMKDGSRIRGNGQLRDGVITTLKTVHSPQGAPLYQQGETLQSVEMKEYREFRQLIVKRKIKYKQN